MRRRQQLGVSPEWINKANGGTPERLRQSKRLDLNDPRNVQSRGSVYSQAKT